MVILDQQVNLVCCNITVKNKMSICFDTNCRQYGICYAVGGSSVAEVGINATKEKRTSVSHMESSWEQGRTGPSNRS